MATEQMTLNHDVESLSMAHPDSREDETLVIFDFDGTLVPGDSLASLITKRIVGNPGRLLTAIILIPLAAPLILFTKTRTFAGSLIVWLATVGLSRRHFVHLVRNHVLFHLLPKLNPQTLALLREHLQTADRVVVASGSLAMIVRHFLRQVDIHGVRVVGSRLRRCCGGLVAKHHCYGEAKAARISAVTGRDQWDLLYTDSKADLPVMRRAKSVKLVRPSRATIRAVSELIADGRASVMPEGVDAD